MASFLAPNGVLQIYDTDNRVPPWTLGFGDWSTRTFKWGTNSGTGKGTVVDSGTISAIRFSVKCTPTAGDGTKDLGLAVSRGYLDTAADWKNVEITGYFDIVKITNTEAYSSRVTWYGPSGRHPAVSGPPDGCTGSAYKADCSFIKGELRFNKEVFHDQYVHDSWKPQDTATTALLKSAYKQGKRLGFKYVNFLYQRADGKTVRRMEEWIDVSGSITYTQTPGNNWKLLNVREDEGNWGTRMKECGCPSDTQIISWGGPRITYRTDYHQIKLSIASVQEIKPPAQVHPLLKVVTPPPPITCKRVSRWECTDGTKTWLAGPDYKYNGELA